MIWRALTHNLGWKLGSLMLAVLLWLAIVGEPEAVTTHPVPIHYRNLPRDLLIDAEALDQIRVDLRGASSKLTSSSITDMAVVLDLSSVSGPGERTFTLSEADLHVPPGVTFLRAVPSQLRLRFARLLAKDVPLQVRIAAPPPAGYRLARQEVMPGQLRIAGPEGRVLRTESAQTDAIDLSQVTTTSDIRVNTFVVDPQVHLESPPIVTVRVTVEKSGKKD